MDPWKGSDGVVDDAAAAAASKDIAVVAVVLAVSLYCRVGNRVISCCDVMIVVAAAAAERVTGKGDWSGAEDYVGEDAVVVAAAVRQRIQDQRSDGFDHCWCYSGSGIQIQNDSA